VGLSTSGLAVKLAPKLIVVLLLLHRVLELLFLLVFLVQLGFIKLPWLS
jgi:hypothetical protein